MVSPMVYGIRFATLRIYTHPRYLHSTAIFVWISHIFLLDKPHFLLVKPPFSVG